MKILFTSVLVVCLLAGCKEEIVAVPDPVNLTEENVSFFCQMNVLEHGGPKAQIHLEGMPVPLFFAQVRDAVAYLKSPERDGRILVTYVSDMSVAKNWDTPGIDNWIAADSALFVVEAGVAGGMGAPEVVPFATEAAAEEFIRIYGGRAVSLLDIPDEAVLGPVDTSLALKEPQ